MRSAIKVSWQLPEKVRPQKTVLVQAFKFIVFILLTYQRPNDICSTPERSLKPLIKDLTRTLKTWHKDSFIYFQAFWFYEMSTPSEYSQWEEQQSSYFQLQAIFSQFQRRYFMQILSIIWKNKKGHRLLHGVSVMVTQRKCKKHYRNPSFDLI